MTAVVEEEAQKNQRIKAACITWELKTTLILAHSQTTLSSIFAFSVCIVCQRACETTAKYLVFLHNEEPLLSV